MRCHYSSVSQARVEFGSGTKQTRTKDPLKLYYRRSIIVMTDEKGQTRLVGRVRKARGLLREATGLLKGE